MRRALVTDGLRHEPGATPDGGTSAVPVDALDFDFVLERTVPGGPRP